jgi:GntR family transcriptional regulator
LSKQIVDAILVGTLGHGDRLPTCEFVSVNLQINQNTVRRVYKDLSIAGLVESRPGLGTFVAAPTQIPKTDDVDLTALTRWLQRGIALGLDREDMQAIFDALVDKLVSAY